jgi:hypothetical protein
MSSLGSPCQPFVCRRLGRSQKSTSTTRRTNWRTSRTAATLGCAVGINCQNPVSNKQLSAYFARTNDWVKFGACNGRRCSPSRSNSICEGKNLKGQIYAKEYLRNRSHPFAFDNKHNGSGPKRMCRRCQGAVWRRAAGCGPHQGLH